jgi:hypothetical protein
VTKLPARSSMLVAKTELTVPIAHSEVLVNTVFAA